MKRRLAAFFLAVCATALGAPAWAQDAYVVGITGAITGPVAGTYAPAVEGIRAYVEDVNGKGGVNGRPIRLVILDNQGEASKAAADARKLLTQDDVVLLVNASISSTYAPMVQAAKRAGVPLFYASAVCPKDVFPPADKLQFCSTGFGAEYDSRMALGFVQEQSGKPRIGFSAMAIPVSRGEIDYAEGLAKKMGMTPVGKQIIPPPTPDYTPFATSLEAGDPEWVYSWAPWVTQVRTFEALKRLGWDGNYISYAHLVAEEELARIKDPAFRVFGTNAFFEDRLPIHDEIRGMAKAADVRYPPEQLTEGIIAGMVLEAALKATPWPATPEKVAASMNDLEVDTRGLRGSPIRWTDDNHFRTEQSYRVYRWDANRNGIVREKDWVRFDVK